MPSSHIYGQHLPRFLVKYVPDKWRSIQQGKLPSSLKLDDLVSSSWLDPDWHRNNTANQKLDNKVNEKKIKKSELSTQFFHMQKTFPKGESSSALQLCEHVQLT